MVSPSSPVTSAFHTGFDDLRRELDIEDEFSPEALAEAATPHPESERAGTRRVDARDLDLVTIDPPHSLDLDQAYGAQRRGEGYEVSYAIADPAAFIAPGGALDQATRRRGVTMYAPDHNTPLHPRVLSEDSASLLAGRDRPAVLWTITLDAEGRQMAARLERATVRSREKLSYREAQRRIDDASAAESLVLLAEIGHLRDQLEQERGGVSLRLPSQEVVATDDGYALRYDQSLPVEDWNAHISLLAGMAAADLMLDAGVGLLRTLPPPPDDTLRQVRRHGLALGIDWPHDQSYQERVRTLEHEVPEHAALLAFAVRALRGAGYMALERGSAPPGDTIHWAIGADYAHVTAPLRRVGDRFANECLLAICADQDVPAWAVEGAEEMPEVLGRARRRERALDRGVVDLAEALLLAPRLGEVFSAVVTTERRDGQVAIQIREPAVAATCLSEASPGEVIDVRLTAADPDARRVVFEPT